MKLIPNTSTLILGAAFLAVGSAAVLESAAAHAQAPSGIEGGVEVVCDPPPRMSQEEMEQRQSEAQEPAVRRAIYLQKHRGTGEVVPGFGGVFVDSEDNSIFYVYLLEPDQELAEEAVQRIIELFGEREVSEVRPLQGQYGYSQLLDWADCWTHRQPRLSDIASSGISEGKNRVSIGVASEEDLGLAQQELEALGIPLEAVSLDVTGRAVPLSGEASFSDAERGEDSFRQVITPGDSSGPTALFAGLGVLVAGLAGGLGWWLLAKR